ncbi:shikimate kinase [Microlunatus endophyticus]|uniref:Shikimate kinase n=1 Tax=Microlunatus endophyticus TaxID=1716077 RepID=A0A917S2F3_9ACTN|nr:shikimate kinase [Microlunatus endophyticus]GGL52969.1 shikimate kinase [Microlunatus endophyticus]
MSDATGDRGQGAMGPIVLVGAPSSGKSTVGRALAARLGVDFVDIDALIEERAGKPIAEIFASDGEPVFRDLETATTIRTLGELSAAPAASGAIVSLGGGAVTSEPIRTALAPYRVVWLQVGIAAAADRIGLNTARPLLLGNVRGQLIKLMREREPLYREVATIGLATDHHEPAELVKLIIEQLPGLQGSQS